MKSNNLHLCMYLLLDVIKLIFTKDLNGVHLFYKYVNVYPSENSDHQKIYSVYVPQ